MKKILLIVALLMMPLHVALAAEVSPPVIVGADPGVPRPAIIFLHGKGGSGAQMRRQIAMDQALGLRGVVAIYPTGHNRQWRVGKFQSLRNDVEYLETMIDLYIAKRVIDPNRLYLVGISNGALMTQRMICQSKYSFAGAAAVMGTHPNIANCKTPKATPLMFFFGSEDRFFPPDGVQPNDWAARMDFTSRDETIKFWRGVNGCLRDVLPAPSRDGKIEARVFQGCRVPLAVYDLIGVGHAWPGAKMTPRLQGDPARNPGSVKIDQVILDSFGLR